MRTGRGEGGVGGRGEAKWGQGAGEEDKTAEKQGGG